MLELVGFLAIMYLAYKHLEREQGDNDDHS